MVVGHIVNVTNNECRVCGKKIPEGEEYCERHKDEKDDEDFTPGHYDGI